jgi:hypothetical protein
MLLRSASVVAHICASNPRLALVFFFVDSFGTCPEAPSADLLMGYSQASRRFGA